MATIVTNLTCELTGAVQVKALQGNLFSADNAGNTINVFVTDHGQPATLGGTISANVIRGDGTTVAVSGAIDGNRAYIILPQACYAVPGVIQIIIKNTESSTVTTIAAVVANVYESTTDTVVDPGTIIPSVASLVEAIEDAVAEIPAGYNACFAPAYSTSSTYALGQYVTYSGYLYRCTTAITSSESWTAAHWTQVALANDVSSLKSAFDGTIVMNGVAPITIPSNSWTLTGGISAGSGQNYTASNLFRFGFTNLDYPIAFDMSDSDYEFAIWVYSSKSASAGVYSVTDKDYTQKKTIIYPLGTGKYFRVGFRRTDKANMTTGASDPTSDEYKVKNSLRFWQVTDKTLLLANVPADAKAVGDKIAELTNTIWFETEPYHIWVNGNINTSTGINTKLNKSIRLRISGNSPHYRMITNAGIKVVVPAGMKLMAYAYSVDAFTTGFEGYTGWHTEGTYLFSDYPYYSFVVAFTDDSDIDPEDADDVIVTNISMTDETLTQKGKPADAYTVGDKLANLKAFNNLSWGMANILANSEQVKSVKWTPVGNIPRLGGGNGYFPQTEQTGLPYSSARDQDKAIGMDVSIHTFMTAVNDPDSVLYTRKSTVSNSACYYGTVCSGMINVAMGINLDLTNYYLADSDMFETIPMQSITEGDMIWVNGHCALVIKASRDRFGRIAEVTVREEWPPLPRDVTYKSWESFMSARTGYIARRFKGIAGVPYTAIPYVQCFDEYPEDIVYPDVQTEFGDAAVFMEGEDVKINVINARDFASIVVKKDGETVQTVTTIESFTIENVEAGLYTIIATGTEYSSESSFFVVDAIASFNTETGVVTFSSTNATPVLVNVYNLPVDRKITCKPIILTDADREAGQINVSEYMDENYQYAKVTFQTPYGTAVWYSETHSKWNPIT